MCYFNNHVEMILLGEVVISINSKVWRGAAAPTVKSKEEGEEWEQVRGMRRQ